MGWAVPGWGHLQVGDDAVLYVLLLLAQEVEAHGVERVGAELVFPQQHLEWGAGSVHVLGSGPTRRGPLCPPGPAVPAACPSARGPPC